MDASQNMATPAHPCKKQRVKNRGTTINAECFHLVIETHKPNIYIHAPRLSAGEKNRRERKPDAKVLEINALQINAC
jgi:hypothetical protein